MTDIYKRIRAWAAAIIEEAKRETLEHGMAGAWRERARGTAAEELLALIESLPAPLTSDEVRTVVRESVIVIAGRFTPAGSAEAIADRVAEKLVPSK